MTLIDRIDADFKAALKAREADRVSCLRMVRAALKNKEKEGRGELTEDDVIRVLKTQAKQRQDSAEQFQAAGRKDLADKEKAELEVISAYLPEEVDQAAIEAAVSRVVAELGAASMKDMGRVMKAALEILGAGADGKLVNQAAKKILSAK